MAEKIYPNDRELHCREEELPGKACPVKKQLELLLAPARDRLSRGTSQCRTEGRAG
jgi:aminoglycoside phosphotransferase